MRKRKKYKFTTLNGKTYREHRLIVERVLGRKLKRCEAVHHIDGNGTNNDLSNLQVIDELKHNILTGRQYRPSANLSLEDIKDIRKMLKDGIKHRLIALAFGVDRKSITGINTGDTWSWV